MNSGDARGRTTGQSTLDALRDDLIERWKAAFGRVAEVMTEPDAATETVYTEYPAFALEGFTAKKFKPGARVSRAPSADGQGYAFRLDAHGRPVQVRYGHPVNRTAWQGIYRYASHEVEHIEVCLQTGVPNLYNRLVLVDGVVTSEQRFVCNSGGTQAPPRARAASARAQAILDDPDGYSIYITHYAIENGVPVSATELHASGGDTHRPTRTYAYNPDGALLRIDQHWPGHGSRTLFAAKTKTTTKSLADDLSNRIAAAILEGLAALPATPRLVALELSYREHDSPIPLLVPLTEADHVDSLALSSGTPSERWLHLEEESFAPAITDFVARAEASANDAVTKMLRVAARRVTERARAELPVAEAFVAFAIDWELEGDELGKILKQCGADAASLKGWRKRGFV